jgi:rhodanese-related sulfurtransferase
MTVEELDRELKAGKPIRILDVREPGEFAIANIGGTLIPLGELAGRYRELRPDEDIVVVCHHGVRSAQAVGFLRQCGYEKTRNLAGGIDRWSAVIDPSVPRY